MAVNVLRYTHLINKGLQVEFRIVSRTLLQYLNFCLVAVATAYLASTLTAQISSVVG